MNDKLIALCNERDALVIETADMAELCDEYTANHDPRKWELLPILSKNYSLLADNQYKIEALFAPEPKKSFLKRLFKK